MKATPFAEGFGSDTPGGRGGKVLIVRNLNDGGPDSFRELVNQPFPRTLIFPNLAGTIRILSTCYIDNPFLTVAFHTAMGPGGIQLRGPNNGQPAGIQFRNNCHDVIFRFMKNRMGGPCLDDVGEPFVVYGTTGLLTNYFFDHCSIQWGTDAQVMFYGACDLGTLQWSLIAEGANSSVTGGSGGAGSGKGPHVKAGRWTEHHNLLALNTQRNPLIQSSVVADVRNELIYGWSNNNGCEIGQIDAGQEYSAQANIVGCRFIPNAESGQPYMTVLNSETNGVNVYGRRTTGSHVYSRDNWGPKLSAPPRDANEDWSQWGTYEKYYIDGTVGTAAPSARALTPFDAPPITMVPVSEVEELILQNAGAIKPFRDAVDQRIVQMVRNRTGFTSATPGAIGLGGPWPDLSIGAVPSPKDTNEDGVPDYIAIYYGFDIHVDCANKVDSSNGYTIIENYHHYLAGDFPGLHIPEDLDPDPAPVDPLPDDPTQEPDTMNPRPLSNPEYVAFTGDVDVAALNLPPWGGIVKWNGLNVLVFETQPAQTSWSWPWSTPQTFGGDLYLTALPDAFLAQLNIAPPWQYHPEGNFSWWALPQETFTRVNEVMTGLYNAAPSFGQLGDIVKLAVFGVTAYLLWKELQP